LGTFMPGLKRWVYLPCIHLAEWRSQIVCRRLICRPSRGAVSKGDALLEAAVQRARGYGVALKPLHITANDIGRGVCQAAKDTNADLVVIASQDRRPLVARGLVDLDKLLGGSVSDYIRVHAPAPVMLVREPERS